MPTRDRIRATDRRWRTVLTAAKQLLVSDPPSVTLLRRLARGVPLLMDSTYRDRVELLLQIADPSELRSSAELSFAVGRSLVLGQRPAEALPWLLRARSQAPDERLSARCAWEIGCVHLERGEIAAAELASRAAPRADGDACPPDIAHLDALLAESRGQLALAEERYRHAIERSGRALSPYTRVAALRNLAAAMCRHDPEEAAGLCGLGLAIVEADELDPRLRPALLNILCYALVCAGRVGEGSERGLQALAEAKRVAAARLQLYARFNLAIARELDGDLDRGVQLLEGIRDDLEPHDELRGWCVIRLAWLAARSGDASAAAGLLQGGSEALQGRVYAESVEALRGIIACLAGNAHEAIERLRSAVQAYDEQGDILTVFALRLWLATAYDRAGRRDACKLAVGEALTIAQRGGFRLSPNYWHPLLIETARKCDLPGARDHVTRLLPSMPPTHLPSVHRSLVEVHRDGLVLVDGTPIDPARWRVGRTGSNVLRRLFALLLASHPMPIPRAEIMDLLWPDSDGDRATANLYAAMNDLRHFLAAIPGLAVEYLDGGYRLRAEANVALEGVVALERAT